MTMKIKTSFKAPFGEIPELRLQYVSRWGIISMDRDQSVAEHSFNVALIAQYICKKTDLHESIAKDVVINALMHDKNEIYTGDLPTPAKVSNGDSYSIIKLADLIESYRYACKHCNDTDQVFTFVTRGIYQKIGGMADLLSIPFDIIKPLVEDV